MYTYIVSITVIKQSKNFVLISSYFTSLQMRYKKAKGHGCLYLALKEFGNEYLPIDKGPSNITTSTNVNYILI